MASENGKVNGSGANEFKYIGKGRKLIDGLEKVTGGLKFTADMKLYNMAYIRPIFSPYAHALINEIDKSMAEEIDGVIAVLTAEDLPTAHRTITSRNSAILAIGRVQWVGQPVAVVVAESPAIAADAADLVFIDYEPLDAAVVLEEAIEHGTPQVWPNGIPKDGDDLSSLHAQVEGGADNSDKDEPNNMIGDVHFERGDIKAGFAESDVIIERTYRTSIVHQSYLEPHAVIVEPDSMGKGLTIYTSTQGQYSVRDSVAHLMEMAKHQVVIKPLAVGGGFGAKYGIYEPLVAAVALTVNRPVRLFLSRSEDLLSTTPAPQTIIKLKTGAKKDGTVTALQAKIYVDNGVFGFSHGGIMSYLLGGYYKFANVKLDAYEIATHKAPVGAYRAPGAPQATFALEGNIDDMAAELGIDPLEFRLMNVSEAGDLNGTGQPWPKDIGARQVLEELKKHPLWENRQPDEAIGIALGGWPTAVGTAEAICRVDTDGTVRIDTGIVDISGTKSSMVLVAAEALGVTPEQIVMMQGDTEGAYGPNSGGSQVTYTVTGAVQDAAVDARQQLVRVAADHFEAAEEDIDIVDGQAQVKGVPDTKVGIGELVSKAQGGRGGFGPIVGEAKSAPPENAPAFAAHLIKIKIDKDSGEITPVDYVTIQDVGFALNPMLVEGQLQGGAVQGLGMALHEAMIYSEDGQLLSGSWIDYSMPRFDNTPNMEVVLLHNPSPHGPFGARGIAESPLTPGPAAVANAVKAITGVRLTEMPMRPERVWAALKG